MAFYIALKDRRVEKFVSTNSLDLTDFTTLSKDKLRHLVYDTAVSYFDNLSPLDLMARSQSSIEAYKSAYKNAVVPFTTEEMKHLRELISKANNLFDNAGFSNLRVIPWSFVKINKKIENGYPHTLADVIVISDALLKQSDADVIQTLIHEKIHVYQRNNPSVVLEIFRDMGLRPLGSDEMRRIDISIIKRLRANPDLDKLLYVHEPSGYVMAQVYTTMRPDSISDSKTIMFFLNDGGLKSATVASNEAIGLPGAIRCQLEHPHEIMACLLAEIISKPQLLQQSDIQKNTFVRALSSATLKAT